MAQHAAITIVSKNYFAFAQTLAQSYLRHHPGHDFIIVLVDKADGLVPAQLDCGAEVIEIAAFRMPDLPRMIYRYSIMELNTAVKPFVLADLFRRRGYDSLLYIDPDIWVFAPLTEVHTALSRASVVLTPHLRRPYFDDASPSEVAILQSGSYNLGFIGLRRGATSEKLLDWWMTKLYRDCVVDIPRGLFVDQKWIDLVPGFFPDHEIIRHPGYNAAYWNLHERPVTCDGDRFLVDARPLVFFHFSGYVPTAPGVLSKHQNRHRLAELPELKRLTDAYAQALAANGYAQSSRWPYAFATLPNGVALPLDLVSKAMQWLSREQIPTPCPITEPDQFCRLLMSRGLVLERPRGVLLFDFILRLRSDVREAFPNAWLDHDDPGFRSWLRSSGVTEFALHGLLPFEQAPLPTDRVADVFARLDKQTLAAFGPLWRDEAVFSAFVVWLQTDAAARLGLTPVHAKRVQAALPGIARVLNLYFLRADLQTEFPAFHTAPQLARFVEWLRRCRWELELGEEEISLFAAFAAGSAEWLDCMRFLYLHGGQLRRVEASPHTIEARRDEIASTTPAARIAAWLADEPALAARQAAGPLVNLAAYFTAPTGMGESGRSLRASLAAAGVNLQPVTLPHAMAAGQGLPQSPALFGWPGAGADVSITVANADAVEALGCFLPASFWARRNIGYWVWETEQLPPRFLHASKQFSEIWTPSHYSAAAIRRSVKVPVHVLPHAIDLPAIDRARGDRARFGLPATGLLFGFAFDPLSVLERKNVRGLIRAFEAAFREDDNCYLVLKANDSGRSSCEFDLVRAEATSDRVLFVNAALGREGMFDFLKSLDAYVSLHRAEGFGLTCAEAMACGLPVIASRYSGNLDFMNDANSLLVPTAVVETDRPHGPYPAGTRWGDPDLQAAAGAMRTLLSVAKRATCGQAGMLAVRQTLSAEAVAARLAALLAPAHAVVERLSTGHPLPNGAREPKQAP